jgi:hypothetical protein
MLYFESVPRIQLSIQRPSRQASYNKGMLHPSGGGKSLSQSFLREDAATEDCDYSFL